VSERQDNTIDRNASGEKADLRSAADLRWLALQEERLAEAANLPRVQEKHRTAARSWALLARSVERAERLAGAPEIALAS